jgi:hypothetical protein
MIEFPSSTRLSRSVPWSPGEIPSGGQTGSTVSMAGSEQLWSTDRRSKPTSCPLL